MGRQTGDLQSMGDVQIEKIDQSKLRESAYSSLRDAFLRGEFGLHLGRFQRGGVAHRQPQRLGARLHRARPVLPAAPGRPRRLAVNGHDLVTGLRQRLQRRHRELGRSHEDDAHLSGLP